MEKRTEMGMFSENQRDMDKSHMHLGLFCYLKSKGRNILSKICLLGHSYLLL